MTDRKEDIRKELYDIVIDPDIMSRIANMDRWVDDKIESLETSQIIIDRKYLTTEYEDELKYAMATKIAESLLNTCGIVEIDSNNVTIKIIGLRK